MKLINMHKGHVWFPAVGTFIITIQLNKELHGGSFMMMNLVNYEFLFVLLSNINWIDMVRIKYEGTQIMNVRFDLLATNQIFNDVYESIDCLCPIT